MKTQKQKRIEGTARADRGSGGIDWLQTITNSPVPNEFESYESAWKYYHGLFKKLRISWKVTDRDLKSLAFISMKLQEAEDELLEMGSVSIIENASQRFEKVSPYFTTWEKLQAKIDGILNRLIPSPLDLQRLGAEGKLEDEMEDPGLAVIKQFAN